MEPLAQLADAFYSVVRELRAFGENEVANLGCHRNDPFDSVVGDLSTCSEVKHA